LVQSLLPAEEAPVASQTASETDMFDGLGIGSSITDHLTAETPITPVAETTSGNEAAGLQTDTNPQTTAQTNLTVSFNNPAPPTAAPVAQTTISTASTPGLGSPWAEQLTQTLTSANSPPAAGNIHLTPGVDLGVVNGLILSTGDSLSGTGSISSPLVNDFGLLSPGNSPGIISVPTFTQGLGGTTLIEIGGTAGAGVNPNGWDQVQVAGAAQLDGTLQISLFNGFVPTAGQSFQVFTWGSHTGEFANWRGTSGIPGHPELAFVPVYSGSGLTLQVVATPLLIPGTQSAIDAGFNTLAQIGTLLNNIGGFAQNIPLLGDKLSSFVDQGAAINNVLKTQLNSLLATLPRQSDVTRAIEAWDGTSVGGFTIEVNGVLGHYGAVGSDPFWWDINIDLIPSAVNRTLQNIAGSVFGAAFASAPSVQVTSKLSLDIGFGYDSGFFLKVDHLAASASINVSGLSGFPFNLAPPGGPLSLSVTNGSVNLTAMVSASPDASVLTNNAITGPRINAATLSSIASSSTNAANAFNLDKTGTLNAIFALNSVLTGFAATFTGVTTVRIQSADILNGADPDVTIVTNGTLKLLNQTLSGSFTFKKTSTETLLEATNVTLDINLGVGAGAKRVLQANNGSGKFLLIGSDLAGSLTLSIAQGPDIPGISISGTTLTLTLNTSANAVPTIEGVSVNLPAGPYYRVAGNAVIALTTPQASLTGNFVFEPRNTDGNPANGDEETTIGFSDLSFSFSDALISLLSVTNGAGAFVVTPTGIYGTATGLVSLAVPGITLSGTFTVLLNNTNAATAARTVNANGTSVSIPALVAGPYLQVRASGATVGTHAQLTVLGITLTGDFLFENRTTAAAHKVVTVAASSLSFDLGSVANDLLTITNGSAAFIITDDGLAGQGSISVAVHADGVTLGGAFTVRLNQTTLAVNETVTVGGAPIVLSLPAGPYLQVTGTGATIGFLGVSLTGNFTFEQKTTNNNMRLVTVSATNVSFNFGTTLVTATNGSGYFVITDTGIFGSGQITANVLAFGAGFSHTFTWDFNNTDPPIDEIVDIGGIQRHLNLPDGPFNRLSSGGPIGFTVNVGGQTQSISAAVVITLVHPDSGSDYATVGLSSLTTTLSAGGVISLAVSGGTGAFVINLATPSKLAGEVKVATATLSGAGGISITATNLELRLNNSGLDVGPIQVSISDDPADDVTVQFTGAYYHDYLAVSGAAEIAIAGYVTIGGDFAFEVSDSEPGKIKVAATELHLDLKAGALTVASFNHGSGAFLISSVGLAGKATLQFQAGIIGMGGTINLEVNSTAAAVNTTINTPTGPTVLNLTNTNYLRVAVQGHLTIGSTSLNFNFYVMVNTGTGAVEFWQTSPNNLLVSISPTGNITLGPSLASLTDLDFAQPGPFEFVSMLRQLGLWFDAFRGSSIFNWEIPFSSGTTLGDAFDWSQLFIDKIYSRMVSVEIQSASMTSATVNTGALAGATLKIQLSSEAAVTLTVTDTIGSATQRTGTELVTLLNNAIGVSALAGRVLARINKDDQVTLALTEAEISKGSNLNLVATSAPIAALGFGPADSDVTTTEHVGVLTARYTTEDFFAQLGSLFGIPVAYNAAQQIYTYTVNYNQTYALAPVNFTFNQDFGPIGNASLNGRLNISANVSFNFTLGFDLGAKEVPRILSSSQVPAPANGRLSEDAHFQIFINGDLAPITLTLAKSVTTTNNSLNDLASDLNTLFGTVNYSGLGSPVALDQLIVAQKAGTGLAISAKPAQLGIINRLTTVSLKTDVFASEMGFGMQLSPDGMFFLSAANANIKGLFVDNASLSASLTVAPDLSYNPNGISGSVRFGFVDINIPNGTFGTLDYNGVAQPLTASVQIKNQTTGATRLYVTELFNGTSSNNIGNMVIGPNLTGSFLARFSNISVGGLGFAFPLGPNPTVSVWVPDIKHLDYNPNPYHPATNNQGLFLTYPSLANLQNFSDINFTQIIHALQAISDNLSQLSAFSFLDERLPLIDMSVNDMIDYAAKFAELIDSAANGGSESLQETLTDLKTQIDQVFHLNPNILTISLDTNGVSPASLITSGGDGTHTSSATINYGGDNNAITIQASANGSTLNGSTIRIVGSNEVTGTGAQATWDATNKVLTVKINPGSTTANAIITAITGLAGSPWTASLVATDNAKPNTGAGSLRTVSLKFAMVFNTSYANTLPFALDLKKLVQQMGGTNPAIAAFLEAATTLVQIQGSGTLLVSASAQLDLSFGLDLSNPASIKPFFYDTTGVVLTAKVLGTNISLQASLGSIVGIWIKNGTLTLDADGNPATNATNGDKGAEFRLGLKDNNGDGRHYFDENWFDFDNIDLHLKGGASAVLPIFAPLESLALGGTADTNHDGYPDNDLVVDIPDLVRLFTDTSATAGVAVLRIPGGNNDLTITRTAGASTNYAVALVENAGVGTGATVNFANNTLTIQIHSDATTASAVQTAINNYSAANPNKFTVAFSDPTGPNNGAGTFTVSKLTLIAPDFTSLFTGLDLCDIIASATGPLLDGLDKLLGEIQEGLDSVVSSTSLPLIGNGLAGAANFIKDFREGLLKSLRDEVAAAGGNGVTAVENAIKKAFWNTLGPGGLDILANATTGAPLDPSLGYGQLDVKLDCDTGLAVKLQLKKEIALVDTSANPIKFDIGVPGFGLKGDGNVIVSVGFVLQLGFGVNKEDGFYFDSSAPASNPELQIYFRVTIPSLHFSGQLLFLQLDIADNAAAPSKFEGHFQVDLKDPNNDGKLTWAELTSSGLQLSDIIAAELGADAIVNLDLAASFGGNTAFPRVLAQFHLIWHFDVANGAGDPQIYFDNVALDVGTFISDFLGPILEQIRKVTEPIQPIIDVVTARIPILSDLAGETVTLLTLSELFGLLEPSTVDFIEDVAKVITLINSLEGIGEGSILIPFGSFSLVSDSSGNMSQISPLSNLANIDFAGAIAGATGPGVSSTFQSASHGFAGDVGSLSNFSIPVFDHPSELFNLFVGKPVRLVEWRMPTFKFQFTYVQKIPIYPPLYAQFGGSIGAEINVGFGYDTFGIQKFIESPDKNPLDLLDGFYILTNDANGQPMPALKLTGEIFAGASIDLVIVEVGVRAGFSLTVSFFWNDNSNNDGKMRVSEIIANAQQDPRCIFNIEGEVSIFLEAYLKVDLFFFSIEKTWRFATIVLISFDLSCPEPVLADLSAGILTLNIGSRANFREHIDTTDNSELFIVRHVDGTALSETVDITWSNHRKQFTGVTKIVILDAGQGDDIIDLRNVLATVDINGGIGNDTIYLSDGANSTTNGGSGNDTITASSSAAATGVQIHGGDGNDILIGGTVAITIFGEGGNDTITGTAQGDTLNGGSGQDDIKAGGGNDNIDGGDGNDVIDAADGADFVVGGKGNDNINGGPGDDVVDGGDNDDLVYGGAGNDLLIGGNGNDRLFGDGGVDLLIGDKVGKVGNFVISFANVANLNGALAGIPTVGVTVQSIAGPDDGSAGDDFLVGGGSGDMIFGGDGDDFCYGGNFSSKGTTSVIEEDGNDFIDGGRGNDLIFGDDSMGRTGDRNTGIAIKSGVWFDANLNGRQDNDERGIAGVIVQLFTASNPPGMGSAVATTQTDTEGLFEFVGLDPNNYIIVFSLPASLQFTTRTTTTVDAASDDSDADPSAGPLKGQTNIFNVTFDQTFTAVSAGYTGNAVVSIADTSVKEGNTGTTQLVFSITLSTIQGYAVEVEYQTFDGTATAANGDYVPVVGTNILVFNPGETSKQIVVLVNADSTYEAHEQFQIQIVRAQRLDPTGAANLLLSQPNALGTLLNDDPIPSIAIQDFNPGATGPEGTAARFIVTLSNPSQYTITVNWRTDAALTFQALPADDAATPSPLAGDDFISANGLLSFQPGVTSQVITVATVSDTLSENDEHFWVDLFNAAYASIADNRAFGVIVDNDPLVSVSIVPVTPIGGPFQTEVLADPNSPQTVWFKIQLNTVSGREVRVTWATSPGTAVESVYSGSSYLPDYTGFPNNSTPEGDLELVFAPGESSKLISVLVNPANPTITTDRMFFVNVLSTVNADIAATPTIESNHATVVIKQPISAGPDVGPWSVYFGDTTYDVQEPYAGSDTVSITIHRTPGSSQAVAVFYTTNGTATSGADYGPVFRQLVRFGDNELTKTIEITIFSDGVVEGDETIILSLRNPTGGPVRANPDTAIVRIHDGNTPAVYILPPSAGSMTEGSTNTSTDRNFRVWLKDPVSGLPILAGAGGVTVFYQTVQLTATAGVDYTGAGGFVVIAPGTSSAPIPIKVFGDTLPELSETFAVRIAAAVGATVAPVDSVAIATIFDDDLTPLTGVVFYDSNKNGFKDLNEAGLQNVKVDVTYFSGGSPVVSTVFTNATGTYTTNVLLGQVNLTVYGDTVKSPWLMFGLGSTYSTTTNNETQVIDYDGIVGLPAFADVGYKIDFTFVADKKETDDVGRGGTDDTLFGGPGDDQIDAGGGDDHVVAGHWMTATDNNVPINQGAYDAVIKAITSGLHPVYDSGPIFEVDTSGLNLAGKISGEIWNDLNNNGLQDLNELFTGEYVVVTLFDCDGNAVNSLATNNGKYSFEQIFVQGTPSEYVVQFDLPKGYTFASPVAGPAATNNDVIVGGRTTIVSISSASPTISNLDAGIRKSDIVYLPGPGSFQFSEPSYSVSESVKNGILTITLTRGSSFDARSVVVRSEDVTAIAGVNYEKVSVLLRFEVGETVKTLDVKILDTNSLVFCTDPLTFNLVLRDVTGKPLDTAVVYIGGQSYGSITDDDTVQGGDDWDILLGDSGNIPGVTVIDPNPPYNNLSNIVYSGGPGKDTVNGGNGPDFVHGQLGDDILAGDSGQDIVFADMGKDVIYVSLDDDQIDGGYGFDTVISTRDVAIIDLISTGANTADLIHRTSAGAPLSTFSLKDVEMAQLFGGAADNVFNITGWNGSAFVVGGGGNDTLLVTNNTDMKLKNASALEGIFYLLTYGFFKDSALSLPNGSTYHLSGLEKATLTGGASANVIDASGYSRPVTFFGLGGNDTLIGGSAGDIFAYVADAALGTDTISGNGGIDTIDFSGTLANVVVNLGTLAPATQIVNGNLSLKLTDKLENLVGGDGNDTLTGNDLANVLIGGLGSDMLAGGAGNDLYPLDTDNNLGSKTIIENIGDAGLDTLDFSGTTTLVIDINLSVIGAAQVVNPNLTVTMVGEGIEQVIGGTRNDVIRGNGNNNVLRGGLGNDLLDGKSGDDILDGGAGNNTLIGGLGVDTVSEQGNTNFVLTNVSLSRGTGQIETLDGIEIMNLTGGADANTFNLTGWTGGGSINGGDVAGSPRNDTVILGADANVVLTDTALDISINFSPISLQGIDIAVITDGAGNHTIDASGFSGITTLDGADGDDILIGGSGPNTLYGGLGNDILVGGAGNNIVVGGGGNNTFRQTSNASLFTLTNAGLVTDVTVAPGDEFFSVFTNIQTVELTGGAAANTFDVTGWTAGAASVNGLAGNDRVMVQATNPGLITVTDTAVTFTGGAGMIALGSIEFAALTGSSGDDTLDASAFTGAAVLNGGEGDDILIAGPGQGLLDGGAGNDQFVFRQFGAAHAVLVYGRDGDDTLDFSAFTLAVSVDLGITGVFQIVTPGQLQLAIMLLDMEHVIGSQGGGTLTGNSLNNTFTIIGGVNTIDGGAGLNRVLATANANMVLSNTQLNIGGTLSNLTNIQAATLTGGTGNNTLDATTFTGATTLEGGFGDDILIGGSGSDVLIGGAGDDQLRGNGGSDTYRFNVDVAQGQDTVDEVAGGGTDLLDFSGATTTGITVDLALTSVQTVSANLRLRFTNNAGIDTVIATDQADVIRGNSLDNIVLSGKGTDTIDGAGGVNWIYAIRDADFVLTNSSLTITEVSGTQAITLVNVQRAFLVGGNGNNTLDASAFTLGGVTLFGVDGNDLLLGGYGDDSLYGGNGDDTIFGWGGADSVNGQDGDDTLNGCGAINTLTGLDGNDQLNGGDGNDTYVFDLSSTATLPAIPQGTDTILEGVGGGFADVIQGIGPGGVAINLWSGAPQNYYDLSLNLVLVLIIGNPGEVEFSF
jgi:Ca2+-binding RTX toxin-like protein